MSRKEHPKMYEFLKGIDEGRTLQDLTSNGKDQAMREIFLSVLNQRMLTNEYKLTNQGKHILRYLRGQFE